MNTKAEKTMAQPIRILIADDYPRSRSGLRALLATWPEVEVVGEAANGREAVHRASEIQPDAVLMDDRMPEMDGLAATRLIKDGLPGIRVVVLTMDAACGADVLAAGADAVLVKGCPAEELLAAILDAEEEER
jgi:DNA-binding NarL/FixJ family response regulator